MKHAALRQLSQHHQQQRRQREEAVGTDETDGQALPDDLELERPTEESGDGVDQYSEISSSKATVSEGAASAAAGHDDINDQSWLPAMQRSFPKASSRRGKMLKKRQNLRQKLKSNLHLPRSELQPPEIATVEVAAAATVVNEHTAVVVESPFRREHACTICGKVLATAGLLRKHSRFHIERSVIPCAHCHALFERQWQYESHLVSAHGLAEQHACPDCERVFSHRGQLLGHMQTSHRKVGRLLGAILTNFKRY